MSLPKERFEEEVGGIRPFILSERLCSDGCWRVRSGDLLPIVGELILLAPENSELVLACLLGLETRGCWRLLGFGESAADDTARGLNGCPSPILVD